MGLVHCGICATGLFRVNQNQYCGCHWSSDSDNDSVWSRGEYGTSLERCTRFVSYCVRCDLVPVNFTLVLQGYVMGTDKIRFLPKGPWRNFRSKNVKMSYCEISRNLEAVRFGLRIILSTWNVTGAFAALLVRGWSNFRAIGQFQTHISRRWYFARSCYETSIPWRIEAQKPMGKQITYASVKN